MVARAALMLTRRGVLTMDEARRLAANIAKLPNYLAANPDSTHWHFMELTMADDDMVKLADRLIPLLKEYDLPNVIQALSWHLMGAVNLANKATSINRELQRALEYAEEKTFWTNDAIKKILREKKWEF
jgi:hypothetical protein